MRVLVSLASHRFRCYFVKIQKYELYMANYAGNGALYIVLKHPRVINGSMQGRETNKKGLVTF